jgi:hypothetical protein
MLMRSYVNLYVIPLFSKEIQNLLSVEENHRFTAVSPQNLKFKYCNKVFHDDLELYIVPFTDLETANVTVQHGMYTSGHLIPPVIYPGVCFCLIL